MAKLRSPNYPNHSLQSALELADKAYKKDGRNKVSRLVLAKHLGHDTTSGPALGKIGALRAYGLIEGSGDELRVSEDAIAALKAPSGSQERKEALNRLAMRPPLYEDIREQFSERPSKEGLSFWLIQQGFSEAAASIASDCYLETLDLLDGLGGGPILNDGGPPPLGKQSEPTKAASVKGVAGERELTTGMLSKTSNFRLVVSGPVGVKEIERLIAKLELDKEILADADAADNGGDE